MDTSIEQPFAEDMESDKVHLGAIIVRDLSMTVSNYRAKVTLEDFCKKQVRHGVWYLSS